MKKKLLIIGICGFVILGLTTGCGSSNVKEKDVTKELNDLVNQCVGEKSVSTQCKFNDDLQKYFETYSDYRLLHASEKEFTGKPKEAKSLFTYGQSTDMLCNYKYALIYNEKTKQAFSIEVSCETKESAPTFKTTVEVK